MKRTTQAQKIAAYDGLARYADDTRTLHYLMAFKPTAPDNLDWTARETAPDDELACVRVQGFGLGRADGGYVLITGWTEETDGSVIGEHVVYAGSALHCPDGGERYYTTPMGMALRAARNELRSASIAAVGAL